jgi:hypothetical protein
MITLSWSYFHPLFLLIPSHIPSLCPCLFLVQHNPLILYSGKKLPENPHYKLLKSDYFMSKVHTLIIRVLGTVGQIACKGKERYSVILTLELQNGIVHHPPFKGGTGVDLHGAWKPTKKAGYFPFGRLTE